MISDSMIYLTDAVLITAVVPANRADAILKVVRALGAAGGIVHMARGTGTRERLGLLGIAVEVEQEVINLVVSTGHQNLIAEAIYRTGGLNNPGGGYLYITALERMATYIPEEARQRLTQQQDWHTP